jgi:hypothetical protein
MSQTGRAAHRVADDMRLHRRERHVAVKLVVHVLVQTCSESISGSLQEDCSTAEDRLRNSCSPVEFGINEHHEYVRLSIDGNERKRSSRRTPCS